jgi:DNA-binding CsgD family transcriptional regulator
MLWTNEDIAKLRRILDEHKPKSVIEITRMMGLGYNVDDVSGVCGAMLMSGKDEEMSAKKIDTAEFWRLVDEKKSAKEIADRFGVSVFTVYKKITKGRPKAEAVAVPENNEGDEDMKKFDWTPEKLEKLLEMGEDAYSPQKIAETLGCDAKAVSNKLYGLKIANGGKIPASRKRRYTVADVTPYKPDAEDANSVDMPSETVDETTETVNETTESVEDETTTEGDKTMDNGGISGLFENTKGAQKEKTDIFDLVYEAKYMAIERGFTPDFIRIGNNKMRREIYVSGKDADGKVHEISYTITDPSKIPCRNASR